MTKMFSLQTLSRWCLVSGEASGSVCSAAIILRNSMSNVILRQSTWSPPITPVPSVMRSLKIVGLLKIMSQSFIVNKFNKLLPVCRSWSRVQDKSTWWRQMAVLWVQLYKWKRKCGETCGEQTRAKERILVSCLWESFVWSQFLQQSSLPCPQKCQKLKWNNKFLKL